MPYVGRFAPSPTGPLHAGSVVAALGSWLDARAAQGRWLVRMEDVDRPRCSDEWARSILRQLEDLHLRSDGPVTRQSERQTHYEQALARLRERQRVFDCGCSRRDVELQRRREGHQRRSDGEVVYPGTCRGGLHGRRPRSVRFAVPSGPERIVRWNDRRLGEQVEDVALAVGDFVLRRADGMWAYQLAVVVDDADQNVTDVVRGEDLADNSARQILLQRALGLPTPRYLHLPLVRAADGRKLSKQNGATAVDSGRPLAVLAAAAKTLGLDLPPAGEGTLVGDWLAAAVQAWTVQADHSRMQGERPAAATLA